MIHVLVCLPFLIHVWNVVMMVVGEQSCRVRVLCARQGFLLRKSVLFLSGSQEECMMRRGPVIMSTSA